MPESDLYKKRVLICPLNWGLGHAARCIPVAQELKRQGYYVDFASDGGPLELLRLEFPEAQLHPLPGYGITYPTNNIVINVGRKMMNFFTAIREEHKAIQEIVMNGAYDIVISDNRFGCYTKHTYNIFITHQVNIMTPGGVLDPAVNVFNHHYIRKYDTCWIPDFPAAPGLSGRLGHDHNLSEYRYIGAVSRFRRKILPVKYQLTAVLSGPEPQRTLLEQKLREQLPRFPFSTALVSGVISPDQSVRNDHLMDHFPYLASEELNTLLLESEIIICRGGYTTLMDLVALGKKAICVPTPGQTEQEYLTQIHDVSRHFLRQDQDDLDLSEAMERIADYTGIPMVMDMGLLVKAVKELEEVC
jgi:hypothetical protein